MKLWQFVKSNPKPVALVAGALVLCVAIFMGLRAAGSAINEYKINALETEKQAALKQAEAARDQNLILQGQVKVKDEQIANLTSQLAESNERVGNAHNETQTARQNLNQVRAAAPRFNAADDAGRIRELGSDLQRLYSDTP